MRSFATKPGTTRQSKSTESAQNRTTPSDPSLERLTDTPGSAGFGHDFSRISIHAGARGRTRPTPNLPDSPRTDQPRLEAEADRVADQMLSRSPAPATRTQAGMLTGPALQRRRIDDGGAPGDIPPQVHSALAMSGRPLDFATRRYFEPRFAHDFSRVRVHVDDAAADSVRAHAFTVGERIVFAASQYRPTTDAGTASVRDDTRQVPRTT